MREKVSVPIALVTVSMIEALAVRDCPSVTVIAIVLVPVDVEAGTIAWNEKVLSPDVASPFVPSSTKACDDDPPIEDRSALTAIPVLAGFEPGVTTAVNRTAAPAATDSGVAATVEVSAVSTTATLVKTTRFSD